MAPNDKPSLPIPDEETGPTSAGDSPRAAEKLVAPGTLLGDYLVGTLLGRGGFGAVYRARNIRTGQKVAMKLLHHRDAGDADDAAVRFAREFDVVRRIGHPNLVRVYEEGVLGDGQLYYTMERLAGQTLRNYVSERGSLSPDECLEILTPVCDALQASHAHGVVHRDLKLSHIILAKEDDARRVVVLDFGIAKLMDDDEQSLDGSNELIGTPGHMSPEQLLSRPIDARTDVYALGAMLFGMLTGRRPFQEIEPNPTREFHLSAQRPRPSKYCDVPAALDKVVERAMAIDMESRYPSTRAFLEGLRAAVAGTPSEPDNAKRQR